MVTECEKKAELEKQENKRVEKENAAKTTTEDSLQTNPGVTLDGDVTDDLFLKVFLANLLRFSLIITDVDHRHPRMLPNLF